MTLKFMRSGSISGRHGLRRQVHQRSDFPDREMKVAVYPASSNSNMPAVEFTRIVSPLPADGVTAAQPIPVPVVEGSWFITLQSLKTDVSSVIPITFFTFTPGTDEKQKFISPVG